MIRIIFVVLAALALSGLAARAQYDCATVRSYVRTYGAAQARAYAVAAGMTATQEREARRCLARRR